MYVALIFVLSVTTLKRIQYLEEDPIRVGAFAGVLQEPARKKVTVTSFKFQVVAVFVAHN